MVKMSLFHKNDTDISLGKILEEEVFYNPILTVKIYLELEKDLYV
jgi:hypothetical protein